MDFEDDLEEKDREPQGWIKLIPLLVAAVLIVVILLVMVLARRGGEEDNNPAESGSLAEALDASDNLAESRTEVSDTDTEESNTVDNTENMENMDDMAAVDESDPQDPTAQELGSQVDVAQLLVSERVQEQQRVTIGIDVSRYQGTIDWDQVAGTGIDFAMIRVGYRSSEEDREIYADTNARYNMQEAQAAGVQVGVYFFSTASTEEEAREEALWVAEYISQYQITYPVAFDCEGYEQEGSVLFNLGKEKRTDIAVAPSVWAQSLSRILE